MNLMWEKQQPPVGRKEPPLWQQWLMASWAVVIFGLFVRLIVEILI